MTSGSLFLHPADPEVALPAGNLVPVLESLGLVGQALPHRDHSFLVGPRFLDLISFMGCSPYVELEPSTEGTTDFCHLVIHSFPSPRLLFGANTRPPRCPRCRKPVSHGAEQLAAMASTDIQTALTCPHCAAVSPLDALRWRQDGGLGQVFVEVCNIFPGEAIPVDALLRRLVTECGTEWDYFYLRSR
jgi:hypothetical protein